VRAPTLSAPARAFYIARIRWSIRRGDAAGRGGWLGAAGERCRGICVRGPRARPWTMSP